MHKMCIESRLVSSASARPNTPPRITPAQSQGARAMLGWSQRDLATKAGISLRALINFEQGSTEPRPDTMAKLAKAFDAAGVEFTRGEGRMGVSVPVGTH